jgi:hypothetical protein
MASIPSAGPPPGRGLSARTAVAIALAAIALLETPLLDVAADVIAAPPLDYAGARRSQGFAGLPVDEIAASLERYLPVSEPVTLGAGLDKSPLLYQRFCEGLYPRLVVPAAPHVLVNGGPPGGVPLAGGVRLTGPAAPDVRPPGQPQPLSSSPLRALVLFVSLLGCGLIGLASADRLGVAGGRLRTLPPGLVLPVTVLAGALVVGLVCSVTSWLGVTLRWGWLAVAGWIGFLAVVGLVAVRLVRGGAGWARFHARAPLTGPLRIEVLLGFVTLAAVAYYVDRTPIVAWDARSIWFFRAKQLFLAGRLLPVDANAYPWQHPEYPLLFPALAAFFSALGGWDERRAAVGITVLLASLMSLVFMLARRALGRWSGAAFAIVPCAYLLQGAMIGYADGFITLCLLVAVLGFASDGTEPVGWLAAFAAAMIKREGFIFAVVLGALHSLIGPSSRGRRWSRRALPFLGFLPTVVHGLWVRRIGPPDTYAGSKLPAQAHEAWARLATIWDAIRAQGWARTPAKVGFAGLVLTIAYARRWRFAPSGMMASLTGLVAMGFTFAVFLVTPFDLAWHLSTALDRLVADFGLLLAGGGILLASTAGPD